MGGSVGMPVPPLCWTGLLCTSVCFHTLLCCRPLLIITVASVLCFIPLCCAVAGLMSFLPVETSGCQCVVMGRGSQHVVVGRGSQHVIRGGGVSQYNHPHATASNTVIASTTCATPTTSAISLHQPPQPPQPPPAPLPPPLRFRTRAAWPWLPIVRCVATRRAPCWS